MENYGELCRKLMAQDKDIRLYNYIWKIHASTYISADLLSMIMISTKYHTVGTIPKYNRKRQN